MVVVVVAVEIVGKFERDDELLLLFAAVDCLEVELELRVDVCRLVVLLFEVF